jgi:hypothetical protein
LDKRLRVGIERHVGVIPGFLRCQLKEGCSMCSEGEMSQFNINLGDAYVEDAGDVY